MKLEGSQVAVLIDASGSMATGDAVGGITRWKAAEEATIALAAKAAQFDPDGITVIPFASSPTVFNNVDASKVAQVFKEKEPNGGTNTHLALAEAFKLHSSDAPSLIIVVTDGEPNDQEAVCKVIRDFAATLSDNGSGDTDEAGILFLQVGADAGATAFLRKLDDGLNAKFDIVDVKTVVELEGMTLTEALLSAFED